MKEVPPIHHTLYVPSPSCSLSPSFCPFASSSGNRLNNSSIGLIIQTLRHAQLSPLALPPRQDQCSRPPALARLVIYIPQIHAAYLVATLANLLKV